MIGKKDSFTGKIGAYDHKLDKLCIEEVYGHKGFKRDHIWVAFDRRLDFKRGTRISFTALVVEYVGLNKKDEQVTKIGLLNLRTVKAI